MMNYEKNPISVQVLLGLHFCPTLKNVTVIKGENLPELSMIFATFYSELIFTGSFVVTTCSLFCQLKDLRLNHNIDIWESNCCVDFFGFLVINVGPAPLSPHVHMSTCITLGQIFKGDITLNFFF